MSNLAKFPVIQKRNLFEDVAKHLRQLILSHKLKHGDRLPPERELAEPLLLIFEPFKYII